jgi:thymidylate synthase (FAD)
VKIIREPKVYLVGHQAVAPVRINDFLRDHEITGWTTDSELGAEILSEVAGRLCYMSFAKPRPGGNGAYLSHIKESGHGSVLEHGVWNFIFTGVSRTLTHELVRHRAGMGYSQLSQRYVDESVAEYVEPDIIAEYSGLHNLWVDAVTAAHNAYVKLCEGLTQRVTGREYAKYLKECQTREPYAARMMDEWYASLTSDQKTAMRKEARQAARSVLPNATETKIFVTANARALRHFIEMRASRFAEPEIRKLAVMVLKILQKEAPNVFGDYELVQLEDGSFEAKTEFRKV